MKVHAILFMLCNYIHITIRKIADSMGEKVGTVLARY